MSKFILKQITLENFRGFENLTLDLDSSLNIIIGENGSGKTAIIDSIAIISAKLAEKFKYIEYKKISLKLDGLDIRYKCPKSSISADFVIEDEKIEGTVSINKGQYTGMSQFDPNELSFYDTPNHHIFAYIDCNDVAFFKDWDSWQEDINLDAVRRVVYSILSDDNNEFENLWQIKDSQKGVTTIKIKKNKIPLSTNRLSSGEKFLLVLALDLARRLAIANSDKDEPLNGHGIVLIDEVGLHLHPRWQREIVPKLRKFFPNCQFIITTHSPLVIGNTKPEHIIMLSDFKVLEHKPYTHGRDVNSVLYELMGVEKRPKKFQKEIDKVYSLIDKDGKIEQAKKVLAELSKDLGGNDIEIVRANSHIDFMEGLGE